MVGLALGFGSLGCVVGVTPSPTSSGPRVFAEAPLHDFGEVPIGTVVRHVFPVQNRGGRPLTLRPVRAACACAVDVSAGGTLAAGQSGWVEVAFDTAGAGGRRVRTVAIETNDPETRELVLTLQGTVVADVVVTPEKVFFGRVPRGASRERTVEVETAPGVSVRRVVKASRRLAVRSVRLAGPRRGIRLHVTLRPQTRPGTFDDSIVVTTTSRRQSEIRIPVLGLVE